ncbi:MAG: formylmethanofuran dehydrogenase [Anaerolineae bacterium]|nr:formylmethanofuran dehydrogenase [Anaerolineae bacterium]
MRNLETILNESASRHRHLCPRQVLGARMGLAGAAALGLTIPRTDKRLLIILETDGCFADGLEVATGCTVGHRTLKVVDYGKVAATFIDVKTEQAIRAAPQLDVREKSWQFAPGETRHYFAQLVGYQQMPDKELLTLQPVHLQTPISQIVSRPGVRVNCTACGEEIMNEREVWRGAAALCQSCTGNSYYLPTPLPLSRGMPASSDPTLTRCHNDSMIQL